MSKPDTLSPPRSVGPRVLLYVSDVQELIEAAMEAAPTDSRLERQATRLQRKIDQALARPRTNL